tara:strand:- start:126 stop:542 length:417 start_codon:yes stop_codon:yes gene_type:complete
MVYDKIWSAEYVRKNSGGFRYEGYSVPLRKECRKTKTDSYLGFVEELYRGILFGIEGGCSYDFVILHNCDDFKLMDSLYEDLQERINGEGLDCLVFSSPKSKEEVGSKGNYLVDVGWFVENGWLGDLEEKVNTQRQIA